MTGLPDADRITDRYHPDGDHSQDGNASYAATIEHDWDELRDSALYQLAEAHLTTLVAAGGAVAREELDSLVQALVLRGCPEDLDFTPPPPPPLAARITLCDRNGRSIVQFHLEKHFNHATFGLSVPTLIQSVQVTTNTT